MICYQVSWVDKSYVNFESVLAIYVRVRFGVIDSPLNLLIHLSRTRFFRFVVCNWTKLVMYITKRPINLLYATESINYI